MNELRLKLELDLTVTADYKVVVNAARTIPVLEGQDLIRGTGRISQSTFKYGVISFPAKSELADVLTSGDKVKVKYKDFLTSINIGVKKGRLTGLTNIVNKKPFMDEFNLGDDIELHFDKGKKVIEFKKP
jgi:hypothetical protein